MTAKLWWMERYLLHTYDIVALLGAFDIFILHLTE